MIFNEMSIWLLGTAVIFTAVGYFWGIRSQLKNTISSTIDTLIKDGYLKTKGTGKDLIVLKWREWENDKTDRN